MLRMTRQRAIILEEIRKSRTHPTADEIYAKVRRHLPRISLGTVYRNLEVLCRAGLVRMIQVGGKRKRFDGCVDNHNHVRCLECGCIDDIPAEPLTDLEQRHARRSSFRIVGHRVEYVGICPECMRKASKARKGGSGWQQSRQ